MIVCALKMPKLTVVLLTLYVFCLMFSPPLIPGVRLLYPLAMLAVIMLATRYRSEVRAMLSETKLSVVLMTFLVITTYTLVLAIINVALSGENQVSLLDYATSSARLILTSPIMLVCIAYVLAVCKRLNYSAVGFMKIIVYAASIQALLSILALMLPWLKDILVLIMQGNVDNVTLHRQWIVDNRLFGFAKDLFDHFGYGMGIVAALPVLIAYSERRVRYLVFIPLLLIPIMLNARTGLVIAALMTLPVSVYALYKAVDWRQTRNVLTAIATSALFVAAMVVLVWQIALHRPAIVSNTISDFRSISEFMTTGSLPAYNSTAKNLFNGDFWALPSSADGILLGTGHSVYSVDNIAHSDVGYVNDIWMYGVLGIIAIYSCLVYFTLRIRKIDPIYGVLAGSLVLSFVVYQIKGTALWSANLGILMHILLCCTILYLEGASGRRSVKTSETNGER